MFIGTVVSNGDDDDDDDDDDNRQVSPAGGDDARLLGTRKQMGWWPRLARLHIVAFFCLEGALVTTYSSEHARRVEGLVFMPRELQTRGNTFDRRSTYDFFVHHLVVVVLHRGFLRRLSLTSMTRSTVRPFEVWFFSVELFLKDLHQSRSPNLKSFGSFHYWKVAGVFDYLTEETVFVNFLLEQCTPSFPVRWFDH
ncbi:hypothetical protein PISMIDRAFT_24666 [Pisolithus microcarpus 441]|uniref:Unplaced genomic scaffold scaffold_123, whole genome shotgun sequence n=1 Tax=Pisolithus microcarpus 441 TaxID=765257 RepID=A0A0C9Z7H6_9AGAM|nr:hypothetical protein PISMIDRAFT_24666 [Pisolithus microcarpus 441]